MKRILAALFLVIFLGGCKDTYYDDFTSNCMEHAIIDQRLEQIAPYLSYPEYQIEADELIHRRIAIETEIRAHIKETGLWQNYGNNEQRGVLAAFSAQLAYTKKQMQNRGFIETPRVKTE